MKRYTPLPPHLSFVLLVSYHVGQLMCTSLQNFAWLQCQLVGWTVAYSGWERWVAECPRWWLLLPVLDHHNSGYVIYGTFDRYKILPFSRRCRDDQWWPVQRKLFLFFFLGGGDPALADVRKKSIFIQSCPFTVSLKTILVCIYSVC